MKRLSNEVSCNRFRGAKDVSSRDGIFGGEDGLTKLDICKLMSNKLREEENINRTDDSIYNKRNQIIGKLKVSHDFDGNTGEGIRENDGETTFREVMLKIF